MALVKSFETARRTALVFAAALLLPLQASAQQRPAQAPAQSAQGAPATTGSLPKQAPPAWLLKCDSAAAGFDCRATQTVLLQQTGQRLLTVVVRRASKAEQPALMLNLPHGVFLPGGATVQIDKDKPISVPIQTSDAQGAYAGSPISKEMLTQMQKAERMVITFQDLKKQPISVPVTLAGFADTYQKMP